MALSRATEIAEDKRTGQGSIFDLMEDNTLNENSDDELPDCPGANPTFAAERELIGFYVSGHPRPPPMDARTLRTCDLDEIEELEHGTHTRFGGMITDIESSTPVKNKNRWPPSVSKASKAPLKPSCSPNPLANTDTSSKKINW